MGDIGKQWTRAMRAQIRAEIAARGLKQADVARLTGMYTSRLSRNLNDAEDRPLDMEFLGEIATALGITPAVIAERAQRRLLEDGGSVA